MHWYIGGQYDKRRKLSTIIEWIIRVRCRKEIDIAEEKVMNILHTAGSLGKTEECGEWRKACCRLGH